MKKANEPSSDEVGKQIKYVNNKKEVVIIGAGPGGYVAAIRAAQLGANVTVIEKDSVGGTCLNVGCIPTKISLHSGSLYSNVLNELKESGTLTGNVQFDWKNVITKKEKTVKQLVGGVTTLLKNKVKLINGKAKLTRNNTVEVISNGEKLIISYDKLIIASGSKPAIPPITGVSGNNDCIDSTGALSLETLPKKVAIIGGGVIGIEFANVFSNFGSEVVVFEAMNKILPMMDVELSDKLANYLKSEGVEIFTKAKVSKIEKLKNTNVVHVEIDSAEKTFEVDKILVAVGRRTDTEDLDLDKCNINNDRGKIIINEFLETSESNIYAIGDCVE